MPRLSKAEREEYERKLREDDEAADDYEVTVGHADGTYEKMPYSTARRHHPERFKDPKPPKADDDKGDDDKGDKGGTRFAGRRVS